MSRERRTWRRLYRPTCLVRERRWYDFALLGLVVCAIVVFGSLYWPASWVWGPVAGVVGGLLMFHPLCFLTGFQHKHYHP